MKIVLITFQIHQKLIFMSFRHNSKCYGASV